MMIDPEDYKTGLQRKSYLELMKKRERLLSFMHQFEVNEIAGDRSDSEWRFRPSPEVRYQVYFGYLAELCKEMRERYNQDYVWGRHTLKQDVEAETNEMGKD